jgi:hypothetical protein
MENSCEPRRRRKLPRSFRWPTLAVEVIRANIDAAGPDLNELITVIAALSGNPRAACWRFARRHGLNAKRGFRRWTKKELRILEERLHVHDVKRVAAELGRPRKHVYAKIGNSEIPYRRRADLLTVTELAFFLRSSPSVVQRWIKRGLLEAENEGTDNTRRPVISIDHLSRFFDQHQKLIEETGLCRRLEGILASDFLDFMERLRLHTPIGNPRKIAAREIKKNPDLEAEAALNGEKASEPAASISLGGSSP